MHDYGMNIPFAESINLSAGDRLRKKMKQWARYLATTVIIIATFVLVGWQFDIEFFKHPLPNSKSMNPAAAVAFISASISFLFLAFANHSLWKRIIGYLFAVLLLLIGLLKFLSIISVLNFQIDTILFYSKVKEDRIVPIAAINFILTAIALLLLNFETRRKKMPAHYIVLITSLFGLLSLVGYLYNVKTSYGVLVYIPMAFHAAFCFLLFSIAILFANPDKGIMNELTSPFNGSIVARFLLPAAIIIPVVLGFLRLWAAWTAHIPLELGTALQILTNVMIFLLLSWFIIVTLNKRDKLKQEAESALKESDEQMQTIFNAAPDAVIVIDEQGKIVKWNPKAESLFGWNEEEVLGKLLSETIIPNRFRESHKKGLQHFLRTGEGPLLGKIIETCGLTKSNEEIDIALNIAATRKIKDHHLFVGFLRNITELKRAEEKFRGLLEAAPDAMIIANEKGEIVLINQQTETLFGYTRNELVGKPVELLIPVDYRSKHEGHRNKYFTEPKVRTMGVGLELFAIRKDGTQFPVEISLSPLQTKEGLLVSASVRDMTDRKKAEEKFRSLLDAAPDATIIVNDKGIIEMINHQTENLFGYQRDELIGKPIELLMPEDIRKEHIGHRSAYIKSPKVRSMGAGIELNAVKKDRTKFPVEISLSPLNTEEGILVSASVRDITDRKKAEEKVRESQVMFSSLFRKSPVMNTITEIHNGKFIEVNDAFAEFMGYTKNELIGKTSNELNVLVNPKDREQVVMNIEENSYVRGREMQIATKDGKIRWVSVNVDKMNLNGKDCLLTAAIDISSRKEAEQLIQKQKQDIQDFIDSMSTLCAKVTTDGKIIIVNKTALLATGLSIEELLSTNFLEGKWWTFDADVYSRVRNAFERACSGVAVTYDENIFVFNQVLTINFSLIPIFKPNAEVDYIVAEGRDITALKITEVALTERTNQLEALNTELEAFSYSVSHDLRAPLRGIIGFSSILEEDYGNILDDEGKRITAVIKSNTIKMGQLIDDLLAFSRMGRQDILKTNIDTRRMVNEVIETLAKDKVKDIEWIIHSLPKVNGDMNTIRQVWINLISNAMKYSGNKERQRIEIGFSDQGRQFVFYVKDNGVGFDEKYKDKLFKVFQRLHSAEDFEGTGVGLALVEKIISKHGGKVWAEGKEGEGACFYFSLPA